MIVAGVALPSRRLGGEATRIDTVEVRVFTAGGYREGQTLRMTLIGRWGRMESILVAAPPGRGDGRATRRWRSCSVNGRRAGFIAMPVLSRQLRCKKCGSKLSDAELAACPNCQTALAETGVTSELIEWGKTRRKGRARYIAYWVLIFGVIFPLSRDVMEMMRNRPLDWRFEIVTWGVPLVMSYFVGWHLWRESEKEYAAEIGERHSTGSPVSGAVPNQPS